jgi:hypothetical protein
LSNQDCLCNQNCLSNQNCRRDGDRHADLLHDQILSRDRVKIPILRAQSPPGTAGFAI